MKGGKIWSTIVDYFLVLSAIIGVGFASGKEICVFFFNFGGASILGLISFGLLYIYLFLVVEYVRRKLELNSFNSFNKKMFGRLHKLSKIVLLINFSITSAGMLAGADYLFSTFFNLKFNIVSLILSVVTVILLIGGISRIKFVANLIVPIMIGVIIINSIANVTPENVNLPIVSGNMSIAIFYGLLFGVNNFVAALPVLFETKLKTKGRLVVILSICLIILLNILVFASNNFSTDMPMFELSANVNKTFYYIYFATLIFALFSTLVICSYNMHHILCRGEKSVFGVFVIVLFNLILSYVGYSFIVNYLYVFSGIISGAYVLILIISMIIQLLKNKNKYKKLKKNIVKSSKKELKIAKNIKFYKNN